MQSYPNRCQHLKINGTQCGSPALRRNRFCFFHKRFQDEQIKLSTDRARRGAATFILPVLEDANSIQITLREVMRLLLSHQIDHKTASLLLYALQTASLNVRHTNFTPYLHDIVLDVGDVANTALNAHTWDDEDFEEEETEADRVRAAAEAERKQKREEAERMRRIEAEFPRATRPQNPSPTTTTVVTASGAAKITPSIPPKKPVSRETRGTLDPKSIREEISELVRREFLPGYKPPATSKPNG